MKKGFDGLYSKDDIFYLYESKSSLETTVMTNHNSNISEAYNDLKKKIEGDNIINNPWKNAYNHISHMDVIQNQTVSKTINKLSKKYVNKEYTKIKEYNLIPSSTIFLGNRFDFIDKTDLKDKIENLIAKYEYQTINVICINKKTIQEFKDFLNE